MPSSDRLVLTNSVPLSAQNLTDGRPKLQIQPSWIALTIVEPSLFVSTAPFKNRVQLSTIQSTILPSKNFKSSVTIWLKSVLFGSVDFGLGKVFLNFLQTLQFSTTWFTFVRSPASRRFAHLNAHMRFSALLWFVTSCIFLIFSGDKGKSFCSVFRRTCSSVTRCSVCGKSHSFKSCSLIL